MTTIEGVVSAINRELSPQFEERLRAALADKEREWLIGEQVLYARMINVEETTLIS